MREFEDECFIAKIEVTARISSTQSINSFFLGKITDVFTFLVYFDILHWLCDSAESHFDLLPHIFSFMRAFFTDSNVKSEIYTIKIQSEKLKLKQRVNKLRG